MQTQLRPRGHRAVGRRPPAPATGRPIEFSRSKRARGNYGRAGAESRRGAGPRARHRNDAIAPIIDLEQGAPMKLSRRRLFTLLAAAAAAGTGGPGARARYAAVYGRG